MHGCRRRTPRVVDEAWVCCYKCAFPRCSRAIAVSPSGRGVSGPLPTEPRGVGEEMSK